MKKHKCVTFAFIISLTALTAQAEEKQTPTDAFRGQTQYQIMKCKLEEHIARQKLQLGEALATKPGKCVRDGKAEVKKVFAPALRAVAKNKEATKLLKDYYASWLTAFGSISPSSNETAAAFSARQDTAEKEYDGIWNRFEIEAGLN